MDTLPGFTIEKDCFFFRPTGNTSVGQLADMMTEALAAGIEHGVTRALIDIRDMYGFDSPGPAYRRWLIRRWAALVGDRVRVVMVARDEHICPERTGLIVAAEEGMNANVFVSEVQALEWLRSGNGTPVSGDRSSSASRDLRPSDG